MLWEGGDLAAHRWKSRKSSEDFLGRAKQLEGSLISLYFIPFASNRVHSNTFIVGGTHQTNHRYLHLDTVLDLQTRVSFWHKETWCRGRVLRMLQRKPCFHPSLVDDATMQLPCHWLELRRHRYRGISRDCAGYTSTSTLSHWQFWQISYAINSE